VQPWPLHILAASVSPSRESILGLAIAGERFQFVSSSEILAAVAERFAPFATAPPDAPRSRTPIVIEVRGRPGRFAPQYERPVEARILESAPGEFTIEGAVQGHYSVTARRGVIEDVSGLGAVDACLRLALSMALPLDGALLLHGAALRDGPDQGIALCGASGSGKSTAAAALGAYCDEHVVLRPTVSGLDLHSTPYWTGTPHRSRCATVVCLARGCNPGVVRLRGAAAVRALACHTVRYVAVERIDRAVLDLLCIVAARATVVSASCPEGDEFIPFLVDKLQLRRAVA
jgi:hypothetical protein